MSHQSISVSVSKTNPSIISHTSVSILARSELPPSRLLSTAQLRHSPMGRLGSVRQGELGSIVKSFEFGALATSCLIISQQLYEEDIAGLTL